MDQQLKAHEESGKAGSIQKEAKSCQILPGRPRNSFQESSSDWRLQGMSSASPDCSHGKTLHLYLHSKSSSLSLQGLKKRTLSIIENWHFSMIRAGPNRLQDIYASQQCCTFDILMIECSHTPHGEYMSIYSKKYWLTPITPSSITYALDKQSLIRLYSFPFSACNCNWFANFSYSNWVLASL